MHIKEVLKNHLETKDVQKVKFDHMIYVRLFEGCNLSCEHCFIPSNPKKIESTFYENKGLTEELMRFAKIKTGQRLYLQWHGGEPTLLGVDYLKQAILNEYFNPLKYKIGNNIYSVNKDILFFKNYSKSHKNYSYLDYVEETDELILRTFITFEDEYKYMSGHRNVSLPAFHKRKGIPHTSS